jgi:hypothetical protein
MFGTTKTYPSLPSNIKWEFREHYNPFRTTRCSAIIDYPLSGTGAGKGAGKGKGGGSWLEKEKESYPRSTPYGGGSWNGNGKAPNSWNNDKSTEWKGDKQWNGKATSSPVFTTNPQTGRTNITASFCLKYLSPAGCPNGTSCKRQHVPPSKKAWQEIKDNHPPMFLQNLEDPVCGYCDWFALWAP